jgi:8-oxo-dGTP diphosphatase
MRFSSIALVDPRGWVLLQERDEHPVIDPECWGFPGGGVEDGESYEQAAYRELEEETGVRLDPGALTLFGEYAVRHGEHDDAFSLWLSGTELTDPDIDCREGRRIVFVAPAEALASRLTTAARIALPDLLQSDAYRSLTP